MKKNQFFLNYLTLAFCFFTFYAATFAQYTCSKQDWCRHEVEIKNTSCCEIEIWCQEIGCDGKDYYMGKLKSGKSFKGNPNAYGAKFRIAKNGSYIHEFPQLDVNGYCNIYNFEFNGSGNSCSKPKLTVSESQHICAGQSVQICADGANNYHWSNGKDQACITVSPNHTKKYSVTGIKNGCEANGEVTVNVSDKYLMPSSTDQHICAGQSVEICGEGADSYHWDNGASSACITVSPNHTKTYTLVGTKNGCNDTDHITVNVNDSFSLHTTGNQTICAGQKVEICADGADHYIWSNGKEKACITVSPNHTKTFGVTGIKNGCEAEAHVEVIVNDSFNLQTTGNQTICVGQKVEICADGADHYVWSNGKEKACITVSPNHTKTFGVTGIKNGCEAEAHVEVIVNDSFNLQTTGNQTICAGQKVEICADGADHYVWSNGKEKACITVSPNHTKTFGVTGIKNGCEAEAHVEVIVNDSFNLQTTGNQTICAGQKVEICADGADHYIWSNGEEKACITVSPNHTKTFGVTGIKNGCEAEAHVEVIVNDSFSVHTTGDQTICYGESVKICAEGADDYHWSNGENKGCITVSPDHTKTYTVVGVKNGCESADAHVTVNVNDSFSFHTSNDKSIYPGESVEICASGADGYYWSNGKGSACIHVNPHETTTYSVSGFKNGCKETGEITVNVNQVNNTCSIDDIKLKENTIKQHKAVVAWTEYANAWYTLYVRESGHHYWHQFETDEARVKLTNLSSCTKYEWAVSIICSNGKVSDACDIRSFTTKGDCNNRVASTEAIGFDQAIEETEYPLSVYPNPATDLLRINYSSLNVENISIYNVEGKSIDQPKVNTSGVSTIELDEYANGIYVIMINANDQIYKNVFIVE